MAVLSDHSTNLVLATILRIEHASFEDHSAKYYSMKRNGTLGFPNGTRVFQGTVG